MGSIDIIDFIPVGHDNAVKRDHLCNILGMTDREVRDRIEAARLAGSVIINLQDGAGYFQPNADDFQLVERQSRQQYSRAMKILAGNKSCRLWLNKISGQAELEV